MRKVLQVQALPDFEPAIGRWLWALEEVRRRTLRLAQDLKQHTLDWQGPGGDENSIGSLLYHIGIIEISWLYMDILQIEIPPALHHDFALEATDASGRLVHVPGLPVQEHLGRLNRSREYFLRALRDLTAED